jgi:hypothetical protein
MRHFWYKQFLNPDMEINDVVIDRERTWYSLDDMHTQFINNIEFYMSLNVDLDSQVSGFVDAFAETGTLMGMSRYCKQNDTDQPYIPEKQKEFFAKLYKMPMRCSYGMRDYPI